MSAVLEFRNLYRSFKRCEPVLRDVSFALGAGEVAGLLGRNGAGKTTLIHTAMGLLSLDSGAVRVFGLSPFDNLARLAGATFNWRRTRLLPRRVRGLLALSAILLLLALCVAHPILGRRLFAVALRTAARALPTNRVAAALVLALPIAALRLALDKIFSESEHRGKLGVARGAPRCPPGTQRHFRERVSPHSEPRT
ncbi:MAG TPA: ATP-binding cassette domain-containing protein [Bryobacteraceae bacterium]|nr:ATP-binding cassette domain-containing protein [Bryobacteraceae bacterium]